MAAQLPGRTDNDVKNYCNTKLKKGFLAGKNSSTTIATGCKNCSVTKTTTSSQQHFSTFTLQPQVEAFVFDQKKNSACLDSLSVLDLKQTQIPVPPPTKEISVLSNEATLAEQNNHSKYDHDDAILLEFVLDDLLNHGFASLDK